MGRRTGGLMTPESVWESLDMGTPDECWPWTPSVEPVAGPENARRSPNFNGAKTHCPQGHPYEGTNLVILWNGGRSCRACINAGRRRRRARALPKDVTP